MARLSLEPPRTTGLLCHSVQIGFVSDFAGSQLLLNVALRVFNFRLVSCGVEAW